MELRRTMLERHARYVPVMDGATLHGVVSFHDVAKAVYDEQNFENRMLKSYIKDWPDEASPERGGTLRNAFVTPEGQTAPGVSRSARWSRLPHSRALQRSMVSDGSVRSAAMQTSVPGCNAFPIVPEHRLVAIGRLDEELRLVARARIAFHAPQCVRARFGLDRKVPVEREALPVHAGGHQREQDCRRSHQRNHAKARVVRRRNERRAGIRHAGAAGVRQQTDVRAFTQRREQRRQVLRGAVASRVR